MITERFFAHADGATAVLADEIAERLTAGVAARGAASFVATGGTTPGGLYDALSRRTAPWRRVSVALSDDRWVEPTDPASNERLVRERLLVGAAAAAVLTPLKTAHATPEAACIDREAALAALPRPFDVCLLGMGVDGHVASLVPGAEGLAGGLDTAGLVCAVNAPSAAGRPERLSLTVPALLASRLIVLWFRGEDKLQAYRRALAGGDPAEAPVRALLRQDQTPVWACWAP
ncbi:6-phosphogluconolactonase [Caulobacter sp. 17J65-9]|uniref:6-phosphogluconolactonase n=1 Tax=Caulobacter sp. 17J65-9 TaxID=2709382 RepID=UPI0013CDB72B|nr:6-phosphogluconolactonase [Caulobacter sp. 17J65-9]NEX94006.1 6-phosphogluconolactonase [Caulobacter sp. 17J65-9]